MPDEKQWQKALGTTRKFWVSVDITFKYGIALDELVEATSEENAKERIREFLQTNEGKQAALHHIAGIIYDNIHNYGEDLAEYLSDADPSEIKFGTNVEILEEDKQNDISPTIPL